MKPPPYFIYKSYGDVDKNIKIKMLRNNLKWLLKIGR